MKRSRTMVRKPSNKLMIHPSFSETLADIKSKNIRIPSKPSYEEFDYYNYIYPPNGKLVTVIDKIKKVSLEPEIGQDILKSGRPIMAYDESITKFMSLEGTSYLTSHSIVVLGEKDYIPSTNVTLYFYTRSKELKTDLIKYSKDIQSQSKKDFILDKIGFLKEHIARNAILLIDGPLIGGDWYIHMIRAIEHFSALNVIPIFFVKNSNSNLVTDEIKEFNGKFNSDMHWSYRFLNKGERTNFFKYTDIKNKKNTKLFCYMKAFNTSPQRIEFHQDTFVKYREEIPNLMNYIYYLLLVQGNKRNPQIRPIVIAEKYARASLKLFDLSKMMKNVGITATLNQERFAW